MSMKVHIPGRQDLELEYLLLDQNGTLSNRGELLEGVDERLQRLSARLSIHILSADAFGTLGKVAKSLGVQSRKVGNGAQKRAFVDRLGGDRCVAIGNGYNDVDMFNGCSLAIAVIGPEGLSSYAFIAAQVICASIIEALDLLLEPQVLAATLRV